MFDKYNLVAVLTAYKRNYFELQIESLISQTVPPDVIVIFQNESHTDLTQIKQKYGEKIKIIKSELNTKFWGRFAISQIFNSEFVLILDDDIIPGNKWVENCFRLALEKNCVVCANGRSFNNDNGFGDSGVVDTDTRAAFGGHSWFFKKEWLAHFWNFSPVTYDTGEDITFCAAVKILGGIETWVPKQSLHDGTSAHMRNFSGDDNASWRSSNWGNKRLEICQHFISLGWN
jgi:glycosyltransferase involved in cell wall biosynthesis